ncbi:hypothetical protein QZH41_000535 [Actinostola sp. cb2023]|nr:hypothetical protein QZH41_000535 [Actinostola sp. cb2023]
MKNDGLKLEEGDLNLLFNNKVVDGQVGEEKPVNNSDTETKDQISFNILDRTRSQLVEDQKLDVTLEKMVARKMKSSRAPLNPVEVVTEPFKKIAIDIVGELPRTTTGYKYILTIVDYATRYPEAIPLRTTNSKTIADVLVQYFCRVGIPKELVSDQGSNFIGKLMTQLYEQLGIAKIKTSVYHPQANGLVERFNGTLKAMLKKFAGEHVQTWDKYLPYLLFAYREVPTESTGYSPFELLYGRMVRGPLAVIKETWLERQPPNDNLLSHVLEIRQVLQRLRDCRLHARPSKCKIAMATVDFVGHRVGGDRIEPRAALTQAVERFPRPETKKQVTIAMSNPKRKVDWNKYKEKVSKKRAGRQSDEAQSEFITVQRLSSNVEGRCQKYSRIGPLTMVPMGQERSLDDIMQACKDHFNTELDCDVLDGERGPSYTDTSQIKNWKVIHIRFIEHELIHVSQSRTTDAKSTPVISPKKAPPKNAATPTVAASVPLSQMLKLGRLIVPKIQIVTLCLEEFSVSKREWLAPLEVKLSVDKAPFASGAFRHAFMVTSIGGLPRGKFVLKRYKQDR